MSPKPNIAKRFEMAANAREDLNTQDSDSNALTKKGSEYMRLAMEADQIMAKIREILNRNVQSKDSVGLSVETMAEALLKRHQKASEATNLIERFERVVGQMKTMILRHRREMEKRVFGEVEDPMHVTLPHDIDDITAFRKLK